MAVGTQRYWVIGLVLSVLGILGGRLSAAPAAKPSAAKAEKSPGNAKASGEKKDDKDATASDPCARGSELVDEYRSLYGFHAPSDLDDADFLIATVPDPDFAEHSSTFDAIQEGLENALTHSSRKTKEATSRTPMLRDRAWLPWGVSDCAARVPGVIIYRPITEPARVHPKIVLLVGENPTWGVREAQLRAAVNAVKLRASPSNVVIAVLGPTFSGSAPSLAAVLKAYQAPGFQFNIVSGSATATNVVDQLQPLGSYQAMVPNDRDLQLKLAAYLAPRQGSSRAVAILSEGATAYGASGADPDSSTSRPWDPIKLRFPLNMKALRESIEATPQPSDGTIEAPDESAQVLVLDEVARDLSRRRVRYVGVVATDGRDVVLLAKELRQRLPDVRLFTLGSNVELLNPHEASALNGMLVAHAAHPALASGDSISLRVELVAAIDAATRRLLGEPVRPFLPRISLIGNGALWEIGDDAPTAKAPVSWFVMLFVWCLLFVFIAFCSLWPHFRPKSGGFLGSALGYVRRPDLRDEDRLVMAALRSVVASGPLLMTLALYGPRPPFEPGSFAARHYLLIGVGVAAIAFAVCWLPTLIALFSKPKVGAAPAALARGEGMHAVRVGKQTAAVCTVLAVGACALALGLGCAPPHEATLNLMCGGSVVLVGLIGFAVIGLSLWCWRVRLRFLETHRFGSSSHADAPPIAQALGETEGQGTGIYEIEARVLSTIRSPWSTFPSVGMGIALLLALSALLVFSVRFPAGFERGWRNYLVIGFILLGLVPVLVNFVRILATWIALNQLLRRLGRLEVVAQLRELPPALTRTLEQQLTISNAKLGDLAVPVDLLEQIDRLAPHSPPASSEASGAPTGLRVAEQVAQDWRAILLVQARLEIPEPAVVHDLVERLLRESARLRGEALTGQAATLRDHYLAALIAIFVPRYVRHFRLYVIPVLLGSVLGVMMTSLYFLQPQRLVTSVISAWVFGMVASTFAVYVSFDRGPVISAIGKSTVGAVQLDWDLVSRVFTWSIVPLLSLVAAQYPGYAYRISQLVTAVGTALR